MFRIISILVLVALVGFNSCSKKDESKDNADKQIQGFASELDQDKASAAAPMEEKERSKKQISDEMNAKSGGKTADAEDGNFVTDAFKEGSSSEKPFFHPQFSALKNARLLEYTLSLSLETKNFSISRAALLDITAKRGFIKSSSGSYADARPYMNAELYVRSSELYDTLKELDRIGILLSESVQAIDHTEDFAQQEIQIKREAIRIARRERLVSHSSSRSVAELESMLGESEDSSDQAAFEKWKILDRIKWAKVTVYLTGPALPATVHVPKFGDAFTDLFNGALYLVYISIYLLPFAAIGGVAAYLFLRWRRKA
ncbi:hypothetical protein CH373_11430 [Leptospira perolatii]|uniref:DUF4349 domain-containing protein n=1 Tax=Leptospira perolatii TaxID=2023191 RepID=A0A2M9ZLX9_9LEPT|nr:DUF4349 domain-containing protein [Leptospira perolatii]PJZ69158.1 hypothetical protein CH360_12835 [Leptospira perolatii]PJZ73098.1 hypothetical protein CH373_11430 [Leptospira perolatii]